VLDMATSPVVPRATLDREWDTFRCRKCQRVLFKFDDGQKRHLQTIAALRAVLEDATASGRLSATEREAIEATFKHDRVIEIKCTLTACKTMNYLMESVR
jgi:phage FluMu protein Com